MYKKEKKGQAALEFLMTYGWAILVVLVVIGALAYFGVLDPNSLIPDKCNVEVGLGCQDFKLTESGLDIYLENGMGRQIIINGITVYSQKISPCSGSFNQKLNNGEGKLLSVTGCEFKEKGRKLKLNVNITYTNTDTNIKHIAKGEILSKIET